MQAAVGKNVKIANPGTGFSSTDLEDAGIGGNLQIVGGIGDDHIELSGVSVGGNTLVLGGAGNNEVRTDTSDSIEFFGGNVTINFGQGLNESVVFSGEANGNRSTIGGNLTVIAADGISDVSLTAINVAGTTAIRTGAGQDSVSVDDCSFGGSFMCNLGDGSDSFQVEKSTGFGESTIFLGGLAINTGAGVDSVEIAAANVATVANVYGTIAIAQAETVTVDPTNAHHIGYLSFL
jgi:hypothetical protein